MHVYSLLLYCWNRVFAVTSAFSWPSSVSLAPLRSALRATPSCGSRCPLTSRFKCCQSAARSVPAHLENPAVATGLEKGSFHASPKGNAKECSNCHTVALISHASKVMLKILQVRLQQYMNQELVQA